MGVKKYSNEFKKQVVKEALETGNSSSDNGPQFIGHKFEDKSQEIAIEYERIPRKTPNKNAHIESFYKILEDCNV